MSEFVKSDGFGRSLKRKVVNLFGDEGKKRCGDNGEAIGFLRHDSGAAMTESDDDRPLTIDDVPRDPRTKEYNDFRDRAAYVYITGTFPTHIRRYFTGLLRAISAYSTQPTSLDTRFGNIAVSPDMAKVLMLDYHPMVVKVRKYLADGYVIARDRRITARRPFSRVNLIHPRTNHVVIIQTDGSILAD